MEAPVTAVLIHLMLTALVLAVGLALLVAAFVYLFDAAQAKRLIQQLRTPLLLGVAVLMFLDFCQVAHTLSVVLMLGASSIVAYLIRESRKPGRDKRHGHGGAERTPVL